MSKSPLQPLHKWGENARDNFKQFRSAKFREQLRELLRPRSNPEAPTKLVLFLISVFGSFISFAGAIWGYIRGYNRFMRHREEYPRLYQLPLIIKTSIAIGITVIWTVLLSCVWMLYKLSGHKMVNAQFILLYLFINSIITALFYVVFRRWRTGIGNMLIETDKHGTARWAKLEELYEYIGNGLYLGDLFATKEKLHCLCCAATRSGKGVNIVIPNILRVRGYEGSMVVLDIKGEAAAICSRTLREQGKNVVILNPWQILPKYITGNDRYNPLSILLDKTSPHLIDDVQVIAEMIVPVMHEDRNVFFTDSARNIVAGLLLHLVTSNTIENPTLTTLWEWIRLSGDEFDNLLADMNGCKDPVNGRAVRNAANEIVKQMVSSETFGSIISHALQCTNFIQSNALQESIQNGFDPSVLSDGNTVVFVIIPPDKLSSHYLWLRLVMTTLIRAVVRKPNKRVTFMIDEAAQLKFMNEIPTALAAYAGYNISMYLIYQDLAQLEATYGALWRSILANCSVQHYFGINDNMTAQYVSEALGTITRTVYTKDSMGGVEDSEQSERPLQTPEEVKRLTKHNIIMLTSGNHPTYFAKQPYYEMPELKDGDKNLFDANPYIKPKQDDGPDAGNTTGAPVV